MHILYQLSKGKVQVEELRQKLSCMEIKMHAVSTLLVISSNMGCIDHIYQLPVRISFFDDFIDSARS